MKIGKYEFNSQEQADLKIKGLEENHNHAIVLIGNILQIEATYNDKDKLIKEAIYSDKYSVDVMWKGIDSHPFGWKSYSIEISGEGVHGFSGVDYQIHKI
jgi:nucleoside-triphosphatase THEP1